MNKNNRVIFLLYNSFRLNLYLSLAKQYVNNDFEVIFVCCDYFTKRSLKSAGYQYRFFGSIGNESTENDLKIVMDSIDVLSGIYKEDVASKLYNSYYRFLLSNLNAGDLVFGGSGLHVQDFALRDVKETINIDTIYTELSNIEGKSFFDSKGSNCASSFYLDNHNREKKLSYKENNILESWRVEYKRKKLSNHIVTQAKKRSIKDELYYIFCDVMDFLLGYPSKDKLRFGNILNIMRVYLKMGISGKVIKVKNKECKLPEKYVFVPLQVTNDAQLLKNSDYDNFDVINYFMNKFIDTPIVIKIHPAEKNAAFIHAINVMVNENNNLFLSDENTFRLIDGSIFVGVNNSTVGFESMILNKPVEFIGRTYYNNLFGSENMYNYLFDYLLDVDFFTGEISCDEDFLLRKIEMRKM